MTASQHFEYLTERDSCRECGYESGAMGRDAGVAGAGDCEGEEGQGGALGGEGEGKAEDDWISAELIGGEIAFERAGRVGPGRGAGTRCEGGCLSSSIRGRTTL